MFTVGALHKVGLHLRGVVRGYEEVRTPKKMMLIHGVMDGDEMAIYNSPEMRLLMLRWYDHWLKDNDTGFMDEPPVIHLRARRRRVPPRGRLADPAHRVPQAVLPPGPEHLRSRVAERRPARVGAAGRDGQLLQLLLSRRGLDPLLRRRHGAIEDGIVHFTRRIPTFVSEPLEDDLRSPATSSSSCTRRPTRATPTSSAVLWTRLPTTSRSPAFRPRAISYARLAQGVARRDEERGAEQALPAVLPARRAASTSRRARCTDRDRGLADVQPVQEGASHPRRRRLRRLSGGRLRRPLLWRQGRQRHVLPRHRPSVASRAAGGPAGLTARSELRTTPTQHAARRRRYRRVLSLSPSISRGRRSWSWTCRTRSCRRAACSTLPAGRSPAPRRSSPRAGGCSKVCARLASASST